MLDTLRTRIGRGFFVECFRGRLVVTEYGEESYVIFVQPEDLAAGSLRPLRWGGIAEPEDPSKVQYMAEPEDLGLVCFVQVANGPLSLCEVRLDLQTPPRGYGPSP